jgi:hypothetical protein
LKVKNRPNWDDPAKIATFIGDTNAELVVARRELLNYHVIVETR